ncbi:MAG: sigma-54 interaction domain-containing protein [Desulfobia sp.]
MYKHRFNNYWKTVVNTIQEGMMIVNTEGRILSVNKAMEEMTGYREDELEGSLCLILNCNICAAAKNKGRDKSCDLFKYGNIQMKHCTITGKDGRIVPIKKNASLLYDDNSVLIGAVETLTDVSEIMEKDQQIESFQRQLKGEDGFRELIGRSPAMQQVYDMIVNASTSDAPVIVYGESGTGKELFARAVHASSPRSEGPLVKVNCAALPETLLESELFGHVKGAFTGAMADRKGRFEAASGGYIFLDEIGEISLGTQVKLLRVLDEKIVEKLGANMPIAVNARVIAATNKNLEELIDTGEFRSDLYYRINVVPIHLPPLRARKDDIPLLAASFYNRLKLKTDRDIKGISREAMEMMQDYHWPGNVRELRSVFEYAFVICQEGMIRPEHIFPYLNKDRKGWGEELTIKVDRKDREKEQLLDALKKSGGNQSEAARILGVSRVTVWNRMKKYGVRIDNAVAGNREG